MTAPTKNMPHRQKNFCHEGAMPVRAVVYIFEHTVLVKQRRHGSQRNRLSLKSRPPRDEPVVVGGSPQRHAATLPATPTQQSRLVSRLPNTPTMQKCGKPSGAVYQTNDDPAAVLDSLGFFSLLSSPLAPHTARLSCSLQARPGCPAALPRIARQRRQWRCAGRQQQPRGLVIHWHPR